MSDSKKTGVREGKSRLAESKWMVDACHLVFGGKICSICLHKRVVLGMQVAGLEWSGLQERITVPSPDWQCAPLQGAMRGKYLAKIVCNSHFCIETNDDFKIS